MLRVLHIVTYMGRGGLETMLMNYYRSIDRTKVQFDFLVHRKERADYDDEIEALGGKIYRISRLNPFSPSYKKELSAFFKTHPEYSIVHVHQDCLSSIVLKQAKKHGVKNRIAHCHSSSQDKNLKFIIKLFYKRFIPAYATKLFACSEEAGKWMFGGAEFEVLNNAIDAKKYIYNKEIRKKIRDEFHIAENEFVIGHVGRFSYPKNHTFLVDVFNEYQKRQQAKLMLVGDGELREEIEKKIRSLNLESKVIFTGVRADVSALLQAMDAFVFPSNYEGLPVTVIEAQAAGLRCFISDKVPIECKKTELVTQLPLTDYAEKWASRIQENANYQRKEMYEEIKKADFDIASNAEKLQDYYLSLR